jgi:putative nucleotidyltransferase with HDIG domain
MLTQTAQVNNQNDQLPQSLHHSKKSPEFMLIKRNNFKIVLEQVNKELWLILSMFVIVGLMNYMVAGQRMMLGLYTLPTLYSAYFYGRRHATLTALASLFLVGIVVYLNPSLLNNNILSSSANSKWYDIGSWGAILIITAYAMGTLYESNKAKLLEQQQTYRGLIVILRQFISKDQYTENHCYRVSVYASKIASYLRLSDDKIEDIRSASLLHDLGKLDISRELLYKAAKLTTEEHDSIKKHVDKGVQMLETANTPLNRIIPIILAHHEKYDGSGYYTTIGNDIPFEARIIAVADVYDALSSDRPYRKAMSPYEVKEIIRKGSGKEFDPIVVKAFLKLFEQEEMDVPKVML